MEKHYIKNSLVEFEVVITLAKKNRFEVINLLHGNHEYRLLTFSEMLSISEKLPNISETFVETKVDRDYTDGYIFSSGWFVKAHLRKKLPVVLTYSDGYLESVAEILGTLNGESLSRYRDYIPCHLRNKPIYKSAGKTSFEEFPKSQKLSYIHDARCYI